MKKPNLEGETPEAERFQRESEKTVNSEHILYHSIFHPELREGAPLDFFAPKSELTEKITNILESTLKQAVEIKALVESGNFSEVERLLGRIDERNFDLQEAQDVVDEIKSLPQKESLPETIKILDHGDVVRGVKELKGLLMDQLNKAEAPVDLQKLRELIEIRNRCYYLSQEKNPAKWDTISFNMGGLLGYGFEIYEANVEAINRVAEGWRGVEYVQSYLDSLRKIRSPEDCLRYSKRLTEDLDASVRFEMVFEPYCPEYLILPPSPQFVAQLIRDNDKLPKMISRYEIDYLDFFDAGEEEASGTLKLLLRDPDSRYRTNIQMDDFDPDGPNYHSHYYPLAVNILFNELVISREKKK